MADIFAAWYRGAPLLAPAVGDFGSWYQGAPLVTLPATPVELAPILAPASIESAEAVAADTLLIPEALLEPESIESAEAVAADALLITVAPALEPASIDSTEAFEDDTLLVPVAPILAPASIESAEAVAADTLLIAVAVVTPLGRLLFTTEGDYSYSGIWDPTGMLVARSADEGATWASAVTEADWTTWLTPPDGIWFLENIIQVGGQRVLALGDVVNWGTPAGEGWQYLISDDGGETFTIASTQGEEYQPSGYIEGGAYLGDNVVILSGEAGIYRSTDNADTITRVHAAVSEYLFACAAWGPNNAVVGGQGGTPGQKAYYSTDGGLTWTLSTLPGVGSAVESLVAVSASVFLAGRRVTATHMAAGSHPFLISTDGGATFTDSAVYADALRAGAASYQPVQMAVTAAGAVLVACTSQVSATRYFEVWRGVEVAGTWTFSKVLERTDSGPNAMGVATAPDGRAYAAERNYAHPGGYPGLATFYVSEDNGLTWTVSGTYVSPQNDPIGRLLYVELAAVPEPALEGRRLGRTIEAKSPFYRYTLDQNIADFGQDYVAGRLVRAGARHLTFLVQTIRTDGRLSPAKRLSVFNRPPDMAAIDLVLTRLPQGVLVRWPGFVVAAPDFEGFYVAYGTDGVLTDQVFVNGADTEVLLTAVPQGQEISVQVIPADAFGTGTPTAIFTIFFS